MCTWRKQIRFETALDLQLTTADQVTEIALFVRTYFWVTVICIIANIETIDLYYMKTKHNPYPNQNSTILKKKHFRYFLLRTLNWICENLKSLLFFAKIHCYYSSLFYFRHSFLHTQLKNMHGQIDPPPPFCRITAELTRARF